MSRRQVAFVGTLTSMNAEPTRWGSQEKNGGYSRLMCPGMDLRREKWTFYFVASLRGRQRGRRVNSRPMQPRGSFLPTFTSECSATLDTIAILESSVGIKSHCWTSQQWHLEDQSVITFENRYSPQCWEFSLVLWLIDPIEPVIRSRKRAWKLVRFFATTMLPEEPFEKQANSDTTEECPLFLSSFTSPGHSRRVGPCRGGWQSAPGP